MVPVAFFVIVPVAVALTVKSSDLVQGDVTVTQPVRVTVPGACSGGAGFGFGFCSLSCNSYAAGKGRCRLLLFLEI